MELTTICASFSALHSDEMTIGFVTYVGKTTLYILNW